MKEPPTPPDTSTSAAAAPTPPPVPPVPSGPTEPEVPASRHTARNLLTILVILALVAGGLAYALTRESPARDAASPSTIPSTQPTTPARPVSFEADAEPLRVSLSWEAGEGGTATMTYEITRNGTPFATVNAPKTNAFDVVVAPGATYRYVIVAVDAEDERSRPVKLVVSTGKLPLSQAPVEGIFDIALIETSHYGFSSFTSHRETAGWRFKPTCPQGACETELHAIGGGGGQFRTTMELSKGDYSGSLTFRGFGSCNGTTTTASITITFHVTKATVDRGMWRASRIEGTMLTRSAAQLGCVSGGIDYDVKGSFVT